jgi:hypothetical protein
VSGLRRDHPFGPGGENGRIGGAGWPLPQHCRSVLLRPLSRGRVSGTAYGKRRCGRRRKSGSAFRSRSAFQLLLASRLFLLPDANLLFAVFLLVDSPPPARAPALSLFLPLSLCFPAQPTRPASGGKCPAAPPSPFVLAMRSREQHEKPPKECI